MVANPPPPLTTTSSETSVSISDFATEVRSDRLDILWKITLAAALVGLWVAFVRREPGSGVIALASLVILMGSLFTRVLLHREHYTFAAWAFMLGNLAATAVVLGSGNTDAVRIAPFAFPFMIFAMGFLLPPVHVLVMFVITIFLTLVVPFTQSATLLAMFSTYSLAAIVMSLLSTLFAVLSTGDLYQVTGWALENYERERRTSHALFENRRQLERSLLRSEVLGEKLQHINEELEMAKHFRGQFLANMSHELRTPLNAIIGFSETMLTFPMMYEDIELPEAYREDLEQIHHSGQQLLTVINDILDLSKVDAGKLAIHITRVRLDPLIDSVIMTAAGLLTNRPVELRRDLIPPLPDVYADDVRLRQVLLNLYSNAVKFTDEGSITIRIRLMDNNVKISVIDTGSGIPEDALESIFEEFSQVENKGRDPRSGAGLGLTISRKLMHLMNGRIWAESEMGVGSTFHIVVPRFDPELHQAERINTPTLLVSTKEVNR